MLLFWTKSRVFIVAVLPTLSSCGFGTYRHDIYWQPTTWVPANRAVWGKGFSSTCGDGAIFVDAIRLESRRTNQAFFYLPIPFTAEQQGGESEKPPKIEIKFHDTAPQACQNLINLHASNLGAVTPSLLRETRRSRVHYCTYQLPSASTLGSEFFIEFNHNLLECSPYPIKFVRKETSGYRSAVGF